MPADRARVPHGAFDQQATRVPSRRELTQFGDHRVVFSMGLLELASERGDGRFRMNR
jgi:hypothetical protein